MTEAADELGVLFPDQEVTVTDPETGHPVDVEVREFRFREGLEAQALARPLIESLADSFEDDGRIEGVTVADVLARHADLWLELVARAVGGGAGKNTEWLASLSDADGDALSDAMWSANGSFFTRRVVATVAARVRKQKEAESGSPSPKSSIPSSGQDTDADTKT